MGKPRSLIDQLNETGKGSEVVKAAVAVVVAKGAQAVALAAQDSAYKNFYGKPMDVPPAERRKIERDIVSGLDLFISVGGSAATFFALGGVTVAAAKGVIPAAELGSVEVLGTTLNDLGYAGSQVVTFAEQASGMSITAEVTSLGSASASDALGVGLGAGVVAGGLVLLRRALGLRKHMALDDTTRAFVESGERVTRAQDNLEKKIGALGVGESGIPRYARRVIGEIESGNVRGIVDAASPPMTPTKKSWRFGF